MSVRIQDNINQRRDTLVFRVKKAPGQEFAPQINQEVVVNFESERIFGGVITNVQIKVESINHIVYEVTCSDYSHLLDRRLVLERFANETVAGILAFILNKYDNEGFTISNVIGDQEIGSITFNRIMISECIEKLAEVTGYSWYVDYYKDIHFFPKNEEAAPFNLTDTSNNYLWESLEISNDLSQIRNIILIEGGDQEGNQRTEEFTAVGTEEERTYYRLAHKFATLPTVKVNNVEVDVGTENFDKDEDFDAMWSFQQKYIRFTSGNIPAETNVITVTGIPLFPIVAKIQNTTSVLQYGPYEFKVKDNSIRTREEARLRAAAELDAFKNGVVEGSFRTYTPGLRSGQIININSPLRGVNEDFLIQSVSFHMRTPLDGEWHVQLATLRTVGIINFLQNLLREKSPIENDQETLLSFLQLADSAEATDDLTLPSDVSSPPYVYGPDAGNVGRWNFATWT